MTQAVVIQYIDDVQGRDYTPGQVVDFPFDILEWLKFRKQVTDSAIAVAAAVAGGAAQLVHLPGSAPKSGYGACGVQLARAAARFLAKYRPGLSALDVIGDSWAGGNGASSGAKSFAGLLAAEFAAKFKFSNYGYAGRPISGYHQAPRVSGSGASNATLIQRGIDDVTFGILGLNDLNGIDVNAGNTGCGPVPANAPNLITRTQAVATWFMAPESSRVRMHTASNSGPNPAVTFGLGSGGTWVHTGYQNNPNFSISPGNAGDYVQFTTPPGDMLVIRHATLGSDAGAMRVTVDGVDILDRGLASQFDQGFFTIDSTIIKLSTGGTHTVKLTRVTPGVFLPDSCDCLDTTTDFSATLLYSPPTHLTAAGWAATAASPNSSTLAGATGSAVWLYDNAGSDRFGGWITAAMDGLFDLGFNVAKLPIREGFNPQWCTAVGDPLHPSDQGHAHIFNRARMGINKLLAGGA